MPDELPRTMQPDLCVIGGGMAGHAMALAAAALGLDVVLVDQRHRLGAGQAADLAETMFLTAATAHARGDAGAPFDISALRRHVARAVDHAAHGSDAGRLRALGVTIIRSTARFADRQTVMTDHAAIRPRRIVVATGGRIPPPPIEAAAGNAVLARGDLIRLTALPERMVVLSDGAAGYGLAQALCRLGTGVTLIERDAQRLTVWDEELLEMVRSALRRDGVAMHRASGADRIVWRAGAVSIDRAAAAPLSFAATHLLSVEVARPAIDGLKLDHAGVRCVDGAPAVGADLRTSNRRVFAIGDVLGPPVPGPAAIPLQVGLVLRAAFFRQPVRYRPGHVPRVLATEPALAQVGSLSGALRRAPGERHTLRWPFADNDKAVASDARLGQVKIEATPRGRILGAGIVGAQAQDLIAPWTLALTHNLPLDAMAALPCAPSGSSDVSRRAALTFVAGRLRNPWIKRALSLLRWLG